MNYNPNDVKHLDIMLDLESGEAAPEPTINVREMLDLDKPVSLDGKILSLCSKLRSDGFDKQASKLESKFAIYKSASTHLYRVHDEDGEDLVNQAHPDGDKEIAEADKDHGFVETIVSKHKKIVDVVNKEPTGKLASYIPRIDALLKKEAVFPLVPIAAAVWSKTRKINQGVVSNANSLLAEIADIQNSPEMANDGAVKLTNAVKDNLVKLIRANVTLEKIFTFPKVEDLKFVNEYSSLISNNLMPNLKSLNDLMQNIRKTDEAGPVASVVRSVMASKFEDVQKAIRGLFAALGEMIHSINEAQDIIKSKLPANSEEPTKQASRSVIAQTLQNTVTAPAPFSDMEDDMLWEKASKYLNIFYSKFSEILKVLEISPNNKLYFDLFKGMSNAISNKNIMDREFFNLNRFIDNLKEDEEPSWYSNAKTKFNWENKVIPMLNLVSKEIAPFNSIIEEITKRYVAKTKNDAESKVKNLENQDTSIEVKKNNEITKLQNIFKSLPSNTKIKQDKKDKALQWIKSQISEIYLASTEEQLNQSIKENQEFERQIKVLEGSNG